MLSLVRRRLRRRHRRGVAVLAFGLNGLGTLKAMVVVLPWIRALASPRCPPAESHENRRPGARRDLLRRELRWPPHPGPPGA